MTEKHARAIVFDAYGTLFDVHASARRFAAEIGPQWQQLSQVWRTKHLEYSWIHGAIGQPATFAALAAQSLDYAQVATGVALQTHVRAALLDGYRTMAPFPETIAALGLLARRGLPLAILSNGDADMLAAVVSAHGLERTFAAVISVAEVGTFKPQRPVYQRAVDLLACPAGEIAFVSSNRWDVAAGVAFGFATFWVNRARAPDEYPTLRPRATIDNLAKLEAHL